MANEVRQEEEERPEVYFIPDNYTDSGRILDGMLNLRNAIEAGALAVVLYFIENGLLTALGLASSTIIIVMLVTIVPIAGMALFGMNGDCFSVFLKSIFRFLKNKRKMRFRRIKKNAQPKKK